MADDDLGDRARRARHQTPFLNTLQAAHYLGISSSALERMRLRGNGPVFRRHGGQIRYHIDDLDDWSQSTSSKASAPESDHG